MKVLVTNVYSYKNKGDAAIVIALLSEIRRVLPGYDIVVQTTDIQNDKDKYGVPISPTLMWTLISSMRNMHSVLLSIFLMAKMTSLLAYILVARVLACNPVFLLSKTLKEYIWQVRSSDVVIACGGGYLRTGSSKPNDSLLLFVTCLNFVLPTYFGKSVYLYSQSIGPVYGKLQKEILRFSLDRVRIVESREDISTSYVKSLDVHAKLMETADPVFLLAGKRTKSDITVDKQRINVGMTVRGWFSDQNKQIAYIDAMAKFIDYLAVEYQAHVYYLPQVIAASFGDDDRLTAEKVKQRLQHKKSFTLLDKDLHPYEISDFCSRLSFFVGTRMHSNIYALINRVPTIAIEYEPKTRGIMRGLGLEEYSISINNVTFDSLRALYTKLNDNQSEYLKTLDTGMASQLLKSKKGIEYIMLDMRNQIT